jgi:anti-sigma regulatory factor (Ser/Thr protein kinase)
MTAVAAIREALTVPGQFDGHHDQVRAARVFTRAVLTGQHPCAAAAVLLVSELVTNSMLHSDSRLPGGTITITVTGTAYCARVEVRDAGGASVPAVKEPAGVLAGGGRGLRLVRDLAARWAYRSGPDGLVTWFEVRAEAASMTDPQLRPGTGDQPARIPGAGRQGPARRTRVSARRRQCPGTDQLRGPERAQDDPPPEPAGLGVPGHGAGSVAPGFREEADEPGRQ